MHCPYATWKNNNFKYFKNLTNLIFFLIFFFQMWKVTLSYNSCIVSNLEHVNQLSMWFRISSWDYGLFYYFFKQFFFPLLNIMPLALNVLCYVSLHSKTFFDQVSLQSHTHWVTTLPLRSLKLKIWTLHWGHLLLAYDLHYI